MDQIEKNLTKVMRVTAVIGAFALLVVSGLAVLDIVVREITGRPIHGVNDIAKLLTIVIVAACFPAGLMERRQIKVTMLEGLFSPTANRIMRIVAEILTGFMFACMAWFLTKHAIKVSARNELSMVLQAPVGPWWWAAAALFWACLPAQLVIILSEIMNRPVAAEEH